MKKLLIIFVLTNSVHFFSQETSSLSSQENVNLNNIYDKADRVAVYPGGIEAFRRNFYQTFNSGKINGRGVIKSEAVFVIGQDGYITDIEIKGDNKSMNKEMALVIKTMSKTKWSPATVDKKPVNFRFKFPISTNIQ